jgi:hypothetical protein
VRSAQARSVRSYLGAPTCHRGRQVITPPPPMPQRWRAAVAGYREPSFVIAIRLLRAPGGTHQGQRAQSGVASAIPRLIRLELVRSGDRRERGCARRQARMAPVLSSLQGLTRRVMGVNPRHPGCLSETAVRSSVVKVRVSHFRPSVGLALAGPEYGPKSAELLRSSLTCPGLCSFRQTLGTRPFWFR